MLTIKGYTESVNSSIATFVSTLPKQPIDLYSPIAYTMALGGKRLRPVLVLMSRDAFSSNLNYGMSQAIGLEFFHNFTLLHDDVMDNADLRRGKPTVHTKWNDNTAILSGDAMLTIATQLMMRDLEPAMLQPVLELFNTTAMEIYEGQQYDMDYENRTDVSIEEYINMIRLKTSVLFGCACALGAILGNTSNADKKAMYDFGVNLGLAFQLQDDYLDVYGDSATFGKEIGGDILNAKRTFMLISAYQKADARQTTRLDELLAINDASRNKEKIKGVTDVYNELAIPALVNENIQHHMNTAIEALGSANLSDEAHKQFTEFANLIMGRFK